MARFTTIGEAGAARSALEAAGIDAWLADENMIAVDWLASQAIHGIKLIARSEDVEQAREVLWSAAAMPPLSETETSEERAAAWPPHSRPACPECGSTDLRSIPRFRMFLVILVVFVAIGAVIGQIELAMTAVAGLAIAILIMPSHRCASCGVRLTPPPQERDEEAPPPDPSDMIETPCPRCGSLEVYNIAYRRLKAVPMLFNPAILIVFPIWLMMPKRRCDACGLEMR